MQGNTLTKQERLCGRKKIDSLFTSSKSGFCYPFRWVMLEEESPIVSDEAAQNNQEPSVSVLFSVPKKNIRRANKRNLLKRRMREAYRLNKHSLNTHLNESGTKISLALLFVSKEPLEYGVIEPAIKKILATVESGN